MATKTPAPKPAAKKPALKPIEKMTDGELIDHMWNQRELKRALDEEAKLLQEKYDEAMGALMGRMEKAGTDKVASSKASVTMSTTVVATNMDWDKVHAYISKHKAFHLLEKRIANAAYREALQLNPRGIPGITPFERKTLNLRALSK
jgi:hypothetical protein